MLLQKLARFFSSDIGIDLGTANCLVYMKDKGIVLSEPSVVARVEGTKEVVEVGLAAKRMLGRTPKNIKAVRPMKYGVIADFDITEAMLKHFIREAKKMLPMHKTLIRPRVLIAVPSGITPVERRAVQDTADRAGAGDIFLIDEPVASAVGVGLPVSDPTGSMIVDIGGGTTEVAVLSLSGIVTKHSLRIGGDEMDAAICQAVKRNHNLGIGPRMAEDLKIEIGSAYPQENEDSIYMDAKGFDLISKRPKSVRITAKELRIALNGPVTNIVEAVNSTFEQCPEEIAGDLLERGIMLAGGGSMLRGLDRRISDATGLPVFLADDPLHAVANGTGIILQDVDRMAKAMALAVE